MQLGVQNSREFWIRHIPDAPKRTYQIVNASGVTLFNVGEPPDEKRRVRWEHARRQRPSGFTVGPLHVGSAPHPTKAHERVYQWGLDDFAGNLRADLTMREGMGPPSATLLTLDGEPLLTVQFEYTVFRLVKARAVAPDGQPVLEMRGNTHDPTFALNDAAGALVASVRNEVVAGHTSRRVDLVGSVDPIHAIVFVIVIDAYSGAK